MSPIKPENRHRYTREWPEIRIAVLKRAGHRCEGSPAYPDCRAENQEAHPVTGSKVVLTIAHVDHWPENNDAFEITGEVLGILDSNLRAWCQRCHLTYDGPENRKKARETRQQRRAK